MNFFKGSRNDLRVCAFRKATHYLHGMTFTRIISSFLQEGVVLPYLQ